MSKALHIAIVDNGTHYLLQLEKLLQGNTYQVVPYSECNRIDPKDFDGVVISGGHSFPVVGNAKRLASEVNFILTCTKPIFGICLGFEIIAATFGGILEFLETKERGVLDIKVTHPDEIFSNIISFQAFESHRWVVKDIGPELLELARSKDGVEAVKHKTRSVYGVQFHPEMFIEAGLGSTVFKNFLGLLASIK